MLNIINKFDLKESDREYDPKNLVKKEEFEKELCKDSKNKTVSEKLVDMKEKTRVSLGPLPIIEHYISTSGLDVLINYKDGMAFFQSEAFPNNQGRTFKYFLHRNGEKIAYRLDDFQISYK